MKKLFCALCAILICLTATACGCSVEDKRSYSIYYGENISAAYYFSMNSDAVLTVYEGGNAASDKENARIIALADGVYDILEDIEKALSATDEDSDVCRFNAAAPGEELQISEITYNVLNIAMDVYVQTGGYYSPAVYYGVQAFGFNSSARYPKTEDELPAKEITDKYAEIASYFSEVKLDEREGKFYVTKPAYTIEVNGEALDLKIDLGGIGKGYATDNVSEYLDETGFESAIFNFGGSSVAAKTYLGGNFTFSFADPRATGGQAYISDVQLKNACVSTSGDNVKYFEIDGIRYSHVFDPFTARPIRTGVMTATVVGGSAAENDGYTTAIMAMGWQKAVEFVKEHLTNRRVAFTFEIDGQSEYYYYTNMQDGSYTLSGDRYTFYTPYADDLEGDGNVA